MGWALIIITTLLAFSLYKLIKELHKSSPHDDYTVYKKSKKSVK